MFSGCLFEDDLCKSFEICVNGKSSMFCLPTALSSAVQFCVVDLISQIYIEKRRKERRGENTWYDYYAWQLGEI